MPNSGKILCSLLLGTFLNCGGDDDPSVDFGEIASNPDFSNFFEGLDEHGISSSFENDESYTLFAFDNETYQDAIEEYNPSADQIKRWLQHHIVGEALSLDQIKRRSALLSLSGSEINVRFQEEGVQLNDDGFIQSEGETNGNAQSYVMNGSLERSLRTKHVEFGATPNATIATRALEEFNVINQFLTVEDEGFIHNLQLFLDVEHENLAQLFISLENEDTGYTSGVFSGAGRGADFQAILADSAANTVSGGFQSGGESYPEDRYKPDNAFEIATGTSMAGRWKLTVFDFRQGVDGTLNEWKLIADIGEERPEPTFVFPDSLQFDQGILVGEEQNKLTWAKGFSETLDIRAIPTSELQEDVSLRDDMRFEANFSGSDVAPVLFEDPEVFVFASFVQKIDESVEEGPHEFEVTARAGDHSRIKIVDVEVVENDREGIELMSHVSLPELGAPFVSGSDIWGWTDPLTGSEIAIMTTANGTTFVDVTEPETPRILGQLLTQTENSNWRDAKVYQNHVYIVSEAEDHGMQVFDLTQLRSVTEFTQLESTTHVGNFGQAHNIVVNEETGFAYVVGSRNAFCGGGLMMYDLTNPRVPQFIDCFGGGVPTGLSADVPRPTDVYIHDAQCVVYNGVDSQHQGKEICLTSDERTVGIVDLSNRANPTQLSRFTYPTVGFTHQGWLSEDQSYFMVNDEFDEGSDMHNTRTYVFDVRDLDNPSLIGSIDNPRDSVGHNFYVKGQKLYQANYTSGLRVLDIERIANAFGEEIAFFDTYPEDDGRDNRPQASSFQRSGGPEAHQDQTFQGAWSNYPFFESGTIIVSDINRGLFVLKEQ